MLRLGIGRFISELRNDILLDSSSEEETKEIPLNTEIDEEAKETMEDKKIFIFLTHDSTLVPFLCMFNYFES
jgi:hypothetical protein